VITGSKPSGTWPASRPTANTTAFLSERPAPNTAIGTNATASVTATPEISQDSLRTSRSSGLCSTSTRCDSAATRPSSVCMPVAKTTARASPSVQVDPMNARPRACRRGTPASARSAERRTGCDSPVSADMSSSSAPSISRTSAGTRSPSSRRMTSPGTISDASSATGCPSRTKVVLCGRYADSASTACSACRSWNSAIVALIRITRITAIPTVLFPIANSSPAATHSSSASGWVSCAATSRGQETPSRRCSSLVPYCSDRRCASALLRPSREVRRSRSRTSRASSTSRLRSCVSGAGVFGALGDYPLDLVVDQLERVL
jgi:hypothetical protein